MKQSAKVFGAMAVGVCGALTNAQLHDGDIVIGQDAGQITTAALVNGAAEIDRVFTGVFGAEGFADFTNSPGFDSFAGTYAPGTVLGFDILAAVKRWAPDASHFLTIAPEQISVRKGGLRVDSPLTESVVAGFAFGDASSTGSFHHHVNYWLIGGDVPNADGAWLLEMRLWAESGPLLASEPFWVVFSQGTGEAFAAEAVEWVRENLIGEACAADLNEDGELDIFDLFAFLSAFSSQDPLADMNEDGVWDFFDVVTYLGLFSAGCP